MKIVCDTSALVELARASTERFRWEKMERKLLVAKGEQDVEVALIIHPISLVELASNCLPEVHHRSAGTNKGNFLEKSTSKSERFRATLELISNWSVHGTIVRRPECAQLELGYWNFVAKERQKYESLTCDSGIVRHQLALADNMIFQLARYLMSKGERTLVFTGDNAMITAASAHDISWIPIYGSNAPGNWKMCSDNEQCYWCTPPTYGGAGCVERFGGP